ncbi:MAG: TIGR02444 family protein [Rhodospirillaceae bacterium]
MNRGRRPDRDVRRAAIADRAPPSFWDFSVRFYADADVQAACLDLQDTHGADVNIALFVLYQALLGRRLPPATVAAVDAAVESWREETVRPLRALRRRLKGASLGLPDAERDAVRDAVKRIELDAEKRQQALMETLDLAGSSAASPAEAARANLQAYAALLGVDVGAPGLTVLLRRFEAGG